MYWTKRLAALIAFLLACGSLDLNTGIAKDLVRPEKVRSKREVVYPKETYDELARLWQEYHGEFPSEDAYANWMYAARYADWADYGKLLRKGLKKYPGNPVLLYLAGNEQHGKHDWVEGREHLEKAVALDPSYLDPWFSLVIHYMDAQDEERTELALRHLLEHGAIAEEILDYSYNLLAGLGENAILITNGDNDTYPGWILTRLLGHRSDVTLVNRSLLNTTWYPGYLIERGLPPFISDSELATLRSEILAEIRSGQKTAAAGGPFGDVLIEKIVTAAAAQGRPVYLSVTMAPTPLVNRYREEGRLLGLANLVTPSHQSYPEQLTALLDIWLSEFRTAGMDSWRLRHEAVPSAGRHLLQNYGGVLTRMVEKMGGQDLGRQGQLFLWYQDHAAPVIPAGVQEELNRFWCSEVAAAEVQAWCRQRGYTR